MSISVVVPGPMTIVVDDGRLGRGHQGVARSGAFDSESRTLANRLVGNDSAAAVLEVLLGPVEFICHRATYVAVTGARADLSINGHARGLDMAGPVPAGSLIRLTAPRIGLRSYIAFRGGLNAAVVLGSRSYDTLGRIGTPPLQAGDEFSLGQPNETRAPWLEQIPVSALQSQVKVGLVLGPREDWISVSSLAEFLHEPWVIRPDSDRTGVRLQGPILQRRDEELQSEAMIPGAVQVPASGQPIILGPDCGTTGGYPVIGVVITRDLGKVAQLRPGDTIRFTAVRYTRA